MSETMQPPVPGGATIPVFLTLRAALLERFGPSGTLEAHAEI